MFSENDRVKRDFKGQLDAMQAKYRSLEAQLENKNHQYKQLAEEFK